MPEAMQRYDFPARGILTKAERRLYPDGRPSRFARLLNRGWAVVHGMGLLPPRFVTLQVSGRRTGRMLSYPLVMVDYSGERYLVSMLGERSSWVRNVRAAGGRAVLRHGRRETVRLAEVDPDARAPIVRRYLSLAPGPRAFIPVDRDAPLHEFQQVAPQIPVFRVRPSEDPPDRKGGQRMKATLSRSPDSPPAPGREHVGWTRGRLVSVLTGGLLVLCSLGLLGVGGYLLSAATSNGSWLALGHGTYHTDSYAVASEPADWSTTTYAFGSVDKVRIRITPSDATTPVFVGMARRDDVQGYLRGVPYVIAHGASGYRVTYTQHDGQAPATPPAHAVPWTAQATGTGTQTLEFDARQQPGDQVLVVMNADGSSSVSGRAESTVTQPSLPWIASGLLAGGVALGAGGALLVVTPVRRVRGRR